MHHKNYMLLDLAAMHTTCPGCIVPEEIRRTLEVGEVAKVIAVTDQQRTEAFWVEVCGLHEGGYTCKVANDLELVPLKIDDLLDIGYNNIQNVGKKKPLPGVVMVHGESIATMNPVLRVMLGLPKVAAADSKPEEKLPDAEPFVHPASDTLQ